MLRFRFHLGLLPPLSHVALEQPVQGGHDGHAEQHAHDPQHPAAYSDGSQHPHARQADGGAHQLGVDEVSLHLLEDDQEDDEDEVVRSISEALKKNEDDLEVLDIQDVDDVDDVKRT